MLGKQLNIETRSWVKALAITATVGLACVASAAFADSGAGTPPPVISGSIGSVADNVRSTFTSLALLMTSLSYIAGIGFCIVSIFKFKSHKDSPQQIPVGTPIFLLALGALLLFLPSVFSSVGKTLFSDSGKVGGVAGVTSFGNFQQ